MVKRFPSRQNGDTAANVLEGNPSPMQAWYMVPKALYRTGHAQPTRPIPLFFVRMEPIKVVCSTRLELKAARSCTAACAVNSDDNGNGWQVGLLVKCIMH